MKEEMYANVCDRYEDLIKEGKSEAAAYNISIAGIGDISDLIDSIRREQGSDMRNPYENGESEKSERVFTMAEKEEIAKYRVRAGIMQSVAIALYILCWVPLVIISSIMSIMGSGNEDIGSIIGLVVMMVMIAVATALLIFKSSIKPLCLKGMDDDDLDEEKKKKEKKRKNAVLNAITSCIWGLTVLGYLVIGFLWGLWHPGWIVFIIAAAVENIIEAIFEIAGKKYI